MMAEEWIPSAVVEDECDITIATLVCCFLMFRSYRGCYHAQSKGAGGRGTSQDPLSRFTTSWLMVEVGFRT